MGLNTAGITWEEYKSILVLLARNQSLILLLMKHVVSDSKEEDLFMDKDFQKVTKWADEKAKVFGFSDWSEAHSFEETKI